MTFWIQNHHHQQWHNRPFWAIAFLISFHQMSLFLSTLLQFHSTSSTIPSFHLNIGLPLWCIPSTVATHILLALSCSSNRTAFPVHFERTIMMCLYIIYFQKSESHIKLYIIRIQIIVIKKQNTYTNIYRRTIYKVWQKSNETRNTASDLASLRCC